MNTKLTTRFASEDSEDTQHNWLFRWDGKGAVGYNGRIFFTGFYISASGMQYKQEKTTAINFDTRMFYQVYVGFRIRAPKAINRFFDKLPI